MTIREFITGYIQPTLRIIIMTHDFEALADLTLDFGHPNSKDMQEFDNAFADAFVNSWYISKYGELYVFVG